MLRNTVSALLVGLALLGAHGAMAQPTLVPQGGGGNSEMDHSRMGGGTPVPGQRSQGAPVLTPQGGGAGNMEMDHSRMGGGGQVGSPQGGTIMRNDGAGPEVRHGHEGSPPQPPRR